MIYPIYNVVCILFLDLLLLCLAYLLVSLFQPLKPSDEVHQGEVLIEESVAGHDQHIAPSLHSTYM